MVIWLAESGNPRKDGIFQQLVHGLVSLVQSLISNVQKIMLLQTFPETA